MTATILLTARQLADVPDDERGELIAGVMQPVSPAKRTHWRLTGRLLSRLGPFVEARGLGEVGPEAGYLLERDPDTVLAPDVSFVAAGRQWPDDDITGFPALAPDLAVEVRSPSNTRADIARKIAIYLAAGVRLVWDVDPGPQTVTVHAPGRAPRVLRIGDALDGEDVLPGFSLPLADLFA